MSLLDPPADDTPSKSRAMIFTVVTVVFVLVVILFFMFRYYPEKKAADNFFNALESGNAAQAYQLWKPSESYTMKDFLADWGPDGYYGTVGSHKILRAKSPRGSSAVAI